MELEEITIAQNPYILEFLSERKARNNHLKSFPPSSYKFINHAPCYPSLLFFHPRKVLFISFDCISGICMQLYLYSLSFGVLHSNKFYIKEKKRINPKGKTFFERFSHGNLKRTSLWLSE
jgi:hypothetical protein